MYWFRTPPDIRVGRAPLDDETIRLIEKHHPEIRFDWPQILRGDEEPPSSLPAPRPTKEPLAELPRPSAAPRPLPPPPPRQTVAPVQLDEQGIASLRARYANLVSMIGARVSEQQRRERLNAEAERLNPDSWVTPEATQRALEEYEAVFESLRSAVGRRRRRRKGRGTPAAPSAGNSLAGGGQLTTGDAPEDEFAAADEEDGSVEEDESDDDAEGGPPAQD